MVKQMAKSYYIYMFYSIIYLYKNEKHICLTMLDNFGILMESLTKFIMASNYFKSIDQNLCPLKN